MMSKTRPISPMIIIIFMLAHHCFLFNFPACCSNWDAPCCSASARWSNSDNFWSRSSTFSTFTRIMPTTSSTCCWVCLSRLFCAGLLVLLPGLYFFKRESFFEHFYMHNAVNFYDDGKNMQIKLFKLNAMREEKVNEQKRSKIMTLLMLKLAHPQFLAPQSSLSTFSL